MISPTAIPQAFRLSPGQSRLWELIKTQGETAFRTVVEIEIVGLLDPRRLESAWESLIRRHEILRTSFTAPPGMVQPLQVIEETGGPLSFEDLTPLAPEERSRRLHEIGRELQSSPLPLGEAPLRAFLVRVEEGRYRLGLAASSLCLDAPSVAPLLAELVRLYDPAAGEPEGEAPQFADLAEWQHELLEEPEGDGRRIWGSQGALRLEPPEPFAVPPAAGEPAPAATPVEMTAGAPAAAARLAARLRVPLEAVLLAVHAVWLGRLSQKEEAAFGVALDGRNYEELESTIGPLSRSVLFRLRLGDAGTFETVVQAAGDLWQEVIRYQEYFAWEEPEAAGGPPTPEVPLIFDFQRLPPPLALGRATLAVVSLRSRAERFSLGLRGRESGGALDLALEHDSGRWPAHQAAVFAGRWGALFADAVARPSERWERLEALTAAERHQVLCEWNDTAAGEGRLDTLTRLFTAQVRRTPDAPAVLFEGEVLTFRELDRRSGALAAHLRSLGAAPSARVAVLLDRSLELVVGLLAVLRSGAAYVPLEPSHPGERLAGLLADCEPVLVLTRSQRLDQIPAGPWPVVLADALPAGEAVAFPETASGPDAAYVLYTSGSTGRPKAVTVSHHAIANRLVWMQETLPLGPADRLLQKTPYSFDASIWEIFCPLFSGALLVLARPGGHQDSAYLVEAVREHGITVLQLVPSMLQVFLQEPEVASCTSLRRLFCGGEAFPAALAERTAGLLPGTAVANLYGPTEAAIDATWLPWSPDLRAEGVLPIGRPLTGVEVHVLDPWQNPLGAGLAGELVIGGLGLARGYHGRPDLTAERFVPDPFATPPGGRLYRTGDLARRREDGMVEFLGRLDHQVKIRGVRIELGEIEGVLAQHPAVREAAVAVFTKGGEGDRTLVAYVVPEEGPELLQLPGGLRDFLAERLPDVMVPSRIVRLPALPRLTNGKLDRRSLPPPGEAGEGDLPAGAADAPATPEEELLAGLWAALLPGARFGRADNFFELGGHSLLAIQLIARIREVFGLTLPLRVIFENPTLSGLAATLAGPGRECAEDSGPPLIPVPRDRGLPLSFAQERLWFLDRLVPGNAAYNLTTALHLRQPPAPAVLARALEELSRRHEALRTRFGTVAGSPLQVLSPPGPAALSRIDLSALGSSSALRVQGEAWRLASAEAARPFDLARGPLFRAVVYRLSADEEWLVLNLHHIVSDGWSTGLLLRDLLELLEAEAAGRPPHLPPLPLQYADFAAWQRNWLQGEILERQTAYWRERLAGSPTLLEMPTDRPRPALQSFRGSSLPLPAGTVDPAALAATARRAGATGFMTALAALGVLLFRYSQQADILVGSPVANRRWPEIQEVVGLFVNTLVLRLELGGDPTVLELIARVRAGALGAYAHQDLPFEKLVEEVQPERNLGHQPLFQVMFTYQKMAPGGAQDLGGPGGLMELGNDSAKFDLNFGLTERGGRLAGVLEHCLDLFDRATAQRLGGHFAAVLAGVASAPERRLSELLLLAEGERHQILVEWNDTRQPLHRTRRIEDGFVRQVAARPEALAVVDGDRLSTYGDLDRSSDRLAWHLRSLGVGPGDFVAVYLDRSLEMVTAVLGILKAGAAYLPVETSSPRPRVSFVLRQLGVRAAVTRSGRAGELRELPDAPGLAHVICLDALEGDAPPGRPAVAAGSEDLAYAIFTSGSTGTPKGVLVRHEPVVNLLDWVNATFAVGPEDSLLFVTSLSFDLSVYDIFGILAAGGSIRVAREDEVRDPARLAARLLDEPVTFWDSAPTALQQVVPFLSPAGGDPRALRLVFLSGDWVPVTLPDRLRAAFPGTAVIALGGATEATVWSNVFPVGEVPPHWRSIPYGRPIRNARYHVLDPALEPSPVGVPGDLYIGGDCLASGYAAEPALTAAKFLPDPFGQDSGGRLYQTGDRARYGADGNLEFLGRRDQQVKIRGFRVELGEIEAVLRQHPQVRESVAAVWDEEPGDRRLAAYVVLSGELEDLTGELRAFVQDRLPGYMVPAAFLALDRLPMTANGKLDRKALPRPGQERPRLARRAEPPRDPLERELAALWEDVLGLRELGVTDDFFELGGHSVLAVRLMGRIGQRFSRELPLSMLFRASTVRELAAELRADASPTGSPLVALRPEGSRAPLFCFHPIGGHVLCYAQLARHLPAGRPVYGLEAVPGAGPASLPEQAARHIAALREVQPRGPYLLAGLSSGGVLAYEIARQLREAGLRVGLVALLDSRPPALGEHLDRLLEPVAFLMGLVREIEISSGRSLGLSEDVLRPLGEDERLQALIERLRALDLMPGDLAVERVRELLDLLRDNQRAVETYRPEPYEGRVALLRASEDLTEPLSGVDEEIRRVLTGLAGHPSFGWDRFARSGIEVHPVPGNHLTMSEEPHVAVLAERLEALLFEAEAGDAEV